MKAPLICRPEFECVSFCPVYARLRILFSKVWFPHLIRITWEPNGRIIARMLVMPKIRHVKL